MIDSVNLNGLSVDDRGRVSFSGLRSGIDFQAAVDNIIAARRIPADNIKAQIDKRDTRIAAYKDLRTLLNTLKESVGQLRGAVSLGGAGDAFKTKAAFASTSRSDGLSPSPAAALLGVTVSNAAAAGTHEIEVLRTAAAHKLGTGAADSLSADLGDAFGGASGSIAGSFELNGRTITVQAGDTLLDLRDRINNANSGEDATGVTASVVSVGSGEHYLVLTASKTGAAMTIGNETGGVLSALGISADGGATFSNELQAARTARLKVDGLTDPDRFESDLVAGSNVALSTLFPKASFPGSFTINGTGLAAVNFTSTTTLADLEAAIDAVNGTTGVSASIVQDAGGLRLVMAHDSGQAFTNSDSSGLLAAMGVDNRLVVERESNTVDDLFNGITLSLFQAEEGTTVRVEIERDLNTVKTRIASFVEAYNAVKQFINTQSFVDPTTGRATDETGALFGQRTLADVEQKLANLLGNGVPGVDQAYSVLAQIGIDFVNNRALADPLLADTLKVDEAKLNQALLSKPDAVRRLFGFDFATSDSRVVLLGFGSGTTWSASGYTLNIGDVGSALERSASVTLSTATLDDAVDGPGATTSGSFTVNGVAVAYDVATDTLDSLADAINLAAIPGVSAAVTSDGAGGHRLEIASTADPLAIGGDTGDLLSSLSFTTQARLVGQANIGGLPDGTDDGTVTVSGNTLTVTDASGASGLKLFYTGTGDLSGIDLDFTVGFGAQLFFTLNGILDEVTGPIEQEIASAETQNDSARNRVDAILARLEIQRQSLLERFLAMETAIATMQRILDSVGQITTAMLADK